MKLTARCSIIDLNVQVCDPSDQLRTGWQASLKCRHEKGNVKRACLPDRQAWQEKLYACSFVWFIQNTTAILLVYAEAQPHQGLQVTQ